MILTLTPNPSLDLLFTADRLVWDDANRVPMPRRRPGGQGVNLVRAARVLEPGVEALAVAPLGGPTGDELAAILTAEGTPLRAVRLDGETRVFVGTRERATGRSLLLNPRGPDVEPRFADALIAAAEGAFGDGADPPGAAGIEAPSWIACCGSLLPGLPADLYARVGELARRHGARFVPDCDGEALALAAGGADLLVPNDMEAARLVGHPVRNAEEAVEAARALVARGCPRVAITLGDRGAVLVAESGTDDAAAGRAGALWARPELPEALAREVAEGSAVGAGDAFLAALLVGGDLAEAVAAGTAVLLGRGPELVRRSDLDRVRPHVRVERVDG